MSWMHWLVWLTALPGHAALCNTAVNHLHALGISRWLIRAATLACYLWAAAAPTAAIYVLHKADDAGHGVRYGLLGGYAALALANSLFYLPWWLAQRLRARDPAVLLDNHTTYYALGRQCHARPRWLDPPSWWLWLPRNEATDLAVQEKELYIPGMPSAWDGFSILHVSDIHLTGRITKEWFIRAFRLAQMRPVDLVVVTGDLIDQPACAAWLPELFEELRAPLGVYGVLGNHDVRRRNLAALQEVLPATRFVDLAGCCVCIELRGRTLLLAGTARPWIAGEPPLPAADDPAASGALRILLSHSPDQFGWARRHHVHLMLAGHTHGGQIQLPRLGAVVAPSHHGVKYAGGTFFEPPTVLHVVRGVSSQLPLRLRCPPEIARLILRCTPASHRAAGQEPGARQT
jgi:predicted MPP superfamily phosphohydrolase